MDLRILIAGLAAGAFVACSQLAGISELTFEETTSQDGGGPPTTTQGGGGDGGVGGIGGAGMAGMGGDGGVIPPGMVTIADHPSGQRPDMFIGESTLTATELFGFAMTSSSAEVSELRLDLSGDTAGLTIANVVVYRDDGTVSGAVDLADTALSPSVIDVAVDRITVTFDPAEATSGTDSWLIVADVSAIDTDDTLQLGLAAGDVDVVGGTATGTVTDVTHDRGAGDLPVDAVRLVYGETTTLRMRTSNGSWTGATQIADLTVEPYWVVTPEALRSSDQILGVAANGQLGLWSWTGTTFVQDDTFNISPASPSVRNFDIEYEWGSRSAMLVYGDDLGAMRYRLRRGGAWMASASLSTAGGCIGQVRWVELASRTNSNELALVYSDENDCLGAAIWDGTSWSNVAILDTAIDNRNWLAFSAAYERAGDLFIAWPKNYNNDATAAGMFWSRHAAGSGTFDAAIEAAYPPFTRPAILALAPRTDSEDISIAYVEGRFPTCGGGGCDDFTAAIWRGVTNVLDDGVIPDADLGGGVQFGGRPGTMPVDVVNFAGEAVAVYADAGSGNTGAVDWALWSEASGWQLQTDDDGTPAMGLRVNIRGVTHGGQASFMLSDNNGSLWPRCYDFGGWGACGTGDLSSALSHPNDGVAIAMTVQQQP